MASCNWLNELLTEFSLNADGHSTSANEENPPPTVKTEQPTMAVAHSVVAAELAPKPSPPPMTATDDGRCLSSGATTLSTPVTRTNGCIDSIQAFVPLPSPLPLSDKSSLLNCLIDDSPVLGTSDPPDTQDVYRSSGARPKVKFTSAVSILKIIKPPVQRIAPKEVDAEASNPILRQTVADSQAIKAGWWNCPVALRVERLPADDDVPVGTDDDVSCVQIEMVAEPREPIGGDSQTTPNQTALNSGGFGSGSNIKYDLSCDNCGSICLPGELSRDIKCDQCSNDIEDDLEDDTSMCNFCKLIFPVKEIDRHEVKCKKNPNNAGNGVNRSRTPRRSEYRRCKYCRLPTQEEYIAEHEHECHLNPFNKASRDMAKRLETEQLMAEFRNAPNPEPADWGYIPAPRSSRSTERRSDRFSLVTGVGLESLPIPCEFCLCIFPAQYLYQHQNVCLSNPFNDRGTNVANGISYNR